MHSTSVHRILVCGLGSVGERHLNNLLQLGYDDVLLYRARGLPSNTAYANIPTFNRLGEALEQRPTVALICNPTHLHVPTAIACAKANCHLFIEKPLGDSLEGVNRLRQVLAAKRKHAMVGYMLRFHPCLIAIKKWVDSGSLGRPIWARSHWGEYLPGWHPDEDYRVGYAALSEMGGGPTLTLSHDIDILLWLFGKVVEVSAMPNRASSLQVNTEHGIDILFKFETGITTNIHLNYFQRQASRGLEIVGEKGSATFDYYQSKACLYVGEGPSPAEIVDLAPTFKRNDMFRDEISYFFQAIGEDRKPVPGIEEGEAVLDVALRALGG